MKKTISVTLGSLVFNIEEDAFNQLNTYLERLKKHFGSAEYGKEVVNDIESRISEQLTARLRSRKSEAATIEDIDEIIKSIGSVEDLSDSEEHRKPTEENARGTKRLYRNPDDKIISGVAGGIASYFGIDPLIPRLLFAVSAFAGGYGILLYILLWVIVPEAQTGSEKLQMKGDAVNLANLTENRKEKKDHQRFSVIRYFLREAIYLLGRILRVIAKIVKTVFGLIATAVGFLGIFIVTLITIVLLVNPDSNYIHPAIAQVFNGSRYVVLVFSGYISIIIPAIVLLLIGVSLVRRKNVFTTSTGMVLSILWLAGALTFGGIAASSADQVHAAVKSIDERPPQSKELSVNEFDSVEALYDQKITITHGTSPKIIVYGTEDQVKSAQANLDNGTLSITHSNGDFRLCIFCINRTMRVEIITPDLKSVSSQNASAVTIAGFAEFENFTIDADSASRVTLKGSVKNATIYGSNAARIDLHGQAQNLKVQLTNAARLDALEFPTKTMDIQAMNASRADINISENLKARASGASRIDYIGSPAVTDLDESNSARIEKK